MFGGDGAPTAPPNPPRELPPHPGTLEEYARHAPPSIEIGRVPPDRVQPWMTPLYAGEPLAAMLARNPLTTVGAEVAKAHATAAARDAAAPLAAAACVSPPLTPLEREALLTHAREDARKRAEAVAAHTAATGAYAQLIRTTLLTPRFGADGGGGGGPGLLPPLVELTLHYLAGSSTGVSVFHDVMARLRPSLDRLEVASHSLTRRVLHCDFTVRWEWLPPPPPANRGWSGWDGSPTASGGGGGESPRYYGHTNHRCFTVTPEYWCAELAKWLLPPAPPAVPATSTAIAAAGGAAAASTPVKAVVVDGPPTPRNWSLPRNPELVQPLPLLESDDDESSSLFDAKQKTTAAAPAVTNKLGFGSSQPKAAATTAATTKATAANTKAIAAAANANAQKPLKFLYQSVAASQIRAAQVLVYHELCALARAAPAYDLLCGVRVGGASNGCLKELVLRPRSPPPGYAAYLHAHTQGTWETVRNIEELFTRPPLTTPPPPWWYASNVAEFDAATRQPVSPPVYYTNWSGAFHSVAFRNARERALQRAHTPIPGLRLIWQPNANDPPN